MSGMFEIVKIIGIIDDPLDVAFVIPYSKFKAEYIIGFGHGKTDFGFASGSKPISEIFRRSF